LSARGPAVWPGNGAKASAVRLAVQTSFPMSFQQQCTTLIIQDGSFLSVTGEKRGEARARMTSKPCCADGLYPFNACDKLRAQSQSISHLSLSVRRSLCSLAPTHVQTCMEWSHADAVYSVWASLYFDLLLSPSIAPTMSSRAAARNGRYN
jgi:hypothetical protein